MQTTWHMIGARYSMSWRYQRETYGLREMSVAYNMYFKKGVSNLYSKFIVLTDMK